MKFLVTLLMVALGIMWVQPNANAVPHPMDPLSADEINITLGIIVDAGNIRNDARLAYLRLYEMEKSDVLSWSPGDPISRLAEAFIQQSNGFFRAIVRLDDRSLTSWTRVESGQAPLTGADSQIALQLVRNNKEWQAAIRKRGITDLDKVISITFSVGYYGDPADREKRLTRVASFYPKDSTNYRGRPIGGVSVLVDVAARKVLNVSDTGVVPISNAAVDYNSAAVGVQQNPVNPIRLTQPGGPSYSIEDHLIQWQGWEMHYRVDPQVGLILSNITFTHDDVKRSVLYQAALSELFVPYMDPSPGWNSRTFIDAGEFGLGYTLTPIIRGADCPENATLLPATMAVMSGNAQVFGDVIAIFERYTGDPAWRHVDSIARTLETRRAQELVVRTIATVGNYDYLFDWIFSQDGTIQIKTGASGIVAAKGVATKHATGEESNRDDSYGRFVDDYIVATNHDHFVMYRLDFDVDGPENNFVKNALRKTTYPPESPRRSGWEMDSSIARNEQEVRMRVNVERPALWRVRSANQKNRNGYPTSYVIHPGLSHISLLSDDDWPQKRAAFSKYTLWMTPFDRDEYFAAGAFPNQSDGSDGIEAWGQNNRSIYNTDLVAWFSLGFHHVVRSEDWPVMPISWHGFTLKPFDFFDRNPVLDLPPPTQE